MDAVRMQFGCTLDAPELKYSSATRAQTRFASIFTSSALAIPALPSSPADDNAFSWIGSLFTSDLLGALCRVSHLDRKDFYVL